MSFRSFPFIVLIASVASCTAGSSSPAVDINAVKLQLDQLHAGLDSAYRRGDASGVASRLTDSVVISPVEGPDLMGRGFIGSALDGFFGSNTVAQYTLTLGELDAIEGTAFGRGTFTWAAGAKGAAAQARRGRFAAVYQRGADGTWRLHRLLENLLPAPPAPPS